MTGELTLVSEHLQYVRFSTLRGRSEQKQPCFWKCSGWWGRDVLGTCETWYNSVVYSVMSRLLQWQSCYLLSQDWWGKQYKYGILFISNLQGLLVVCIWLDSFVWWRSKVSLSAGLVFGFWEGRTQLQWVICCIRPSRSLPLFHCSSVNRHPDIPTFLNVRAVMSYFLFPEARPAVRWLRGWSNHTEPQKVLHPPSFPSEPKLTN